MQAVAAAALAFDETRGAKLSTFMYNQIRFSMWRALQEETHTVHQSLYYLSRWKEIEKAAKKFDRFNALLRFFPLAL
jgi:DNA-directed RNA polymerase sigma subunit (sigma70/sigma32)